jgi:hypothetical protein
VKPEQRGNYAFLIISSHGRMQGEAKQPGCLAGSPIIGAVEPSEAAPWSGGVKWHIMERRMYAVSAQCRDHFIARGLVRELDPEDVPVMPAFCWRPRQL